MIKNLGQILEKAKQGKKRVLSVAVANDKPVLEAITIAKQMGIIDAILVGNEKEIRYICQKENYSLENTKIVDEDDKIKAAAKAVEFVSKGQADFIMKGLLETAVLLKAVLNKEANLRSNSLLSHVMIYDVKTYPKLIFLTDGGMVLYPELKDKIQIIKNAVKVANALDIQNPKVAPLCAIEVINPSMQATVDAAVLTQMNKRGQIKGCLIDGPLALDNAISKKSAEHKGIKSEVSGDVDILLVPNIESGNLLGKSLTYFSHAESAGIVVGAKCPIVLVSRADSAKSKLYSIALGALCVK